MNNKCVKSVFVKMIFCVVIYGTLMNEFLFNRQDGIWHGTFVESGDWELSLGRWVIRYLDALHWGVHIHPLISIITLIFFCFGTVFLVNIFDIEIGSFADYCISLLFLGNVIVCVSLTYLYTSTIYGISFFLSVFCVFSFVKGEEYAVSCGSMKNRKTAAALIVASCSLALMLSLYQAYLGCICLVSLAHLIYLINDRNNRNKRVQYLFLGVGTAVVGFILYEIFLQIELKRYGVGMSSYSGASSFSLSNIILNLPKSIIRAYRDFVIYFAGEGTRWNLLPGKLLICFIVLLIVTYVAVSFIKNKSLMLLAGNCILFCFLPMAVNITEVLIPESSNQEQQTAPYALVFPTIYALLINGIKSVTQHTKDIAKPIPIPQTISKYLVSGVAIVVIWGSIWQTQVDQEAIRQGTLAARSLCGNIMSELIEQGSYAADREYAIIGTPINNPMVYYNDIYENSNPYARIIGEYWNGSLDSATWRGIFRNAYGVELNMCDNDVYTNLLDNDRVMNMPLFPAAGSIEEIDGIWVIKVSQL